MQRGRRGRRSGRRHRVRASHQGITSGGWAGVPAAPRAWCQAAVGGGGQTIQRGGAPQLRARLLAWQGTRTHCWAIGGHQHNAGAVGCLLRHAPHAHYHWGGGGAEAPSTGQPERAGERERLRAGDRAGDLERLRERLRAGEREGDLRQELRGGHGRCGPVPDELQLRELLLSLELYL